MNDSCFVQIGGSAPHGGTLRRLAVVSWLLVSGLAAAQTAPAPNADSYLVHPVRPGETLYRISEQLTRSARHWPLLQKLNGLADPRRLPLGTQLRIPRNLLAPNESFATVEYVSGDVTAVGPQQGSQGLTLGQRLTQGTRILVGADGYVRLSMSDGSAVRLPANTRALLQRVLRQDATLVNETRIELERGRVDVTAKPVGRAGRFEIQTPLAIASVRGTAFAVSLQADASVTGEVTEGAVMLQATAPATRAVDQVARLQAGEGVRVSNAGRLGATRALPAAPDLTALPMILTDPNVVRLNLPGVAGIRGYWIRIARDVALENVVRNAEINGSAVRLEGLPDGSYTLGVRAVDEQGLTGGESTWALRVKAHPIAPLVQQPAPGSIVVGAHVEFSCSQPAQTERFRLQVASDESFRNLVVDADALGQCRHGTVLPVGRYHWRVASVQLSGSGVPDQGPFSSAAYFDIGPAAPSITLPEGAAREGALQAYWTAEPGERFQVDVARDSGFSDLIYTHIHAEGRLELPDQPSGIYYLRIQTIASSGERTPFSPTQVVRVGAVLRDSEGRAVRDAQERAVGRE